MLQLARQHPLVLDSPAPVVRIASDDSAIRYEWLVWQKDYGQRLRLKGDLMEQLWYALRREGHSIPFPVRDVRLQQVEPATSLSEQRLTVSLQNCSAAIHCLQSSQSNNASEFNHTAQFATYGQGETIVSEGQKATPCS